MQRDRVPTQGVAHIRLGLVLVGFLLLTVAVPGSASAAACTNTWIGATEGSWESASNWSAGHAPTSTEVACIGSGKTATVTTDGQQAGILQGEGRLKLLSGSLALASPPSVGVSTIAHVTHTGGLITGPGTLEINASYSTDGASIYSPGMGGSGRTVIKPGATAEIKFPGSSGTLVIYERTFVNEGTLTFSDGNIYAGYGARIENTGTFRANAEPPQGLTAFRQAPGGAARVVNSGTFEKTAGTGTTVVDLLFDNNGTVEAETGTLNFKRGGLATAANAWSAAQGATISFGDWEGTMSLLGPSSWSGHFEFNSGAIVSTTNGLDAPASDIEVNGGTLNVGGGPLDIDTLTFRSGKVDIGASLEPSTIAHVTHTGGLITGAGTLEITGSYSTDGASIYSPGMGGSGRTVIKPGATAEIKFPGSSGTLIIYERTFVNEGNLTFSDGNIYAGYSARIENTGTFRANAEPPQGLTAFRQAPGGAARVVNSGTFEKTSGTGTTVVDLDFENYGPLKEASGKLQINRPVAASSSKHLDHRCYCGDPVETATGDFLESQTDFSIGGRGIGLRLTRSYSAQRAATATTPGAFGYGWTSSFEDKLTTEEGGSKIKLTQADGGIVTFTQAPSGWKAPAWSQFALAGTSTSGYILTSPDQTEYVFSGAGRLENVQDRNGNESLIAYDSSGRIKTITDPAGRQLTFAYNPSGQVESVKDPMGHLVKYAYENGQLSSVTLPGDATPRWQFQYEFAHRIRFITDGRGGKTTNEYDSSSRVISQTDPAGRTITFKYEPFHTTITNKATGAVTSQWFTSNNQPYSITRGFGTTSATTEYSTYNAAGQLLTRTDGLGHTTTYGYDEAGNRTSEEDALGHKTKWTYNATHDLISTTTPRGETTTIVRDSHGNVETVSRPAPGGATQTTTFSHDEHGQLESLTDPLQRTWSFGYDSYGNRTSETDPLGHLQTRSYDKDSRLVLIVSPRGNLAGAEPAKYTTTVERDPQGRPLKVTDPLGYSTKYAYDGNGNLVSVTDAKSRTTKYTYNAVNERTKVEKPNGSTLQTGYDGAGRITSQTDGNGKSTTYVRNVLEQPVEVIDPLGRKTTATYDPAGNLAKVLDASARETTYAYDAAARLIGVNYSEAAMPDPSFEYDADGNVVSMSDGTGKSSFLYDQLGRLTRSQDGHGALVEYSYDLGEQQTGIVYPNGKAISRTYDAAGRLESISDWLGGTTSFGYDADSNLTGVAFPVASGNVDEYAYDRASRMSSAKFKKGSETLASLSYVRDALGQVEKEVRIGLPGPPEVAYGYDQNNRLTAAGTASFEYDAADNLTKGMGSTNTYDAASQLQTGTAATYTYDKLGQRTSATARVSEAPEFLRTFGGAGSGAGTLAAPRDVALDKEGNVWVADTTHNRIQQFNSKGEFIRQLGAAGSGNGQFSSPTAIAVNPSSGDIYVADSGNRRIQQFNSKGEFLRKWGSRGSGNGQFSELSDLALDAEGHVWVLEGEWDGLAQGNRVQEFTAEGTFMRTFGKGGTEAGQFVSAEAITTDAAGNIWVADTGNNRVQAFKPSGEFIRKWGTVGAATGQLSKPRGLAFDAEGKLWVSDSANNRLQRFTPEGAYLAAFGTSGNNNGQFSTPRGVAIDAAGNLWVADTGNDRVQEATATEFLRTFGGTGSGAGTLAAPRDVALDKEGNVWVADTSHNRIQQFNSKGEFLRQLGATGSADGLFSSPRAIAIGPTNGHLYVADSGNRRVQEFTSEGAFVRKWGTRGSGNGQFSELNDLATDAEGHVWVLEGDWDGLAQGNRVQEFTAEGTFMRTFGKGGTEAGQFVSAEAITTDAAGNIWVADTGNNRVQAFKPSGEFIRKWGTAGTGAGQISKPRGLAFDAEGKLWLSDSANNRLQRFSPEGAYLAQLGIGGNNNGRFAEPRGLAIDAAGNLWIADTGNDRVQELAGTEFLRAFGGAGSGAGTLAAPRDVATDKEGNVWVADTTHNRIQQFSSKGQFIREFGALGSANGLFNSPRAIAISPTNGHLYVADSGNRRVQELTAEGAFVRKWGSMGSGNGQFAELADLAIDAAGNVWVLEGQADAFSQGNRVQAFTSEGTFIRAFGKEGTEAGQLREPQAIALDAAGNVWVADTANNRLQAFKPSGEFIRKWGTVGSATGQLSKPCGLAFDSEGKLWVADSANNRLQRFSSEGAYLAAFGATGNNNGQFSAPRGVAIDAAGNLWVADTGNDRVQEAAWPMVTTTYGYDQAGSLTSVERPQTGTAPPLSETFAYDATGLLASRTSGLLTRHMAWDASTGLPLLLNDGENSYIYGPGGLPIAQISSSGSATYIHHDQLGSTRLLTDAGGKASASFSYRPYGELEGKTGTATTPLGFAGQYTDPETGLQYLRARFYDPATGQFLTRDPIEPLTREPYAYGRNNPTNNVDPSGLYAESEDLPCPWCLPLPSAEDYERAAGEVQEGAEDIWHWITDDDDEVAEESAPYDPDEAKEECPLTEPWDLETKIGDAGQAFTRAAQQVKQEFDVLGSNPNAPYGNGPRWKQVAAAVGRAVASLLGHGG